MKMIYNMLRIPFDKIDTSFQYWGFLSFLFSKVLRVVLSIIKLRVLPAFHFSGMQSTKMFLVLYYETSYFCQVDGNSTAVANCASVQRSGTYHYIMARNLLQL